MAERFNGGINDLVNQSRFQCAAELDRTLKHCLSSDNHLIRQRALKHQTAVQARHRWRSEKPQRFVKRV